MELTKYQVQKLIDFKNSLLEDSDKEYTLASIEDDVVKEKGLLVSSNIKHSVAKEIEKIIYNKN